MSSGLEWIILIVLVVVLAMIVYLVYGVATLMKVSKDNEAVIQAATGNLNSGVARINAFLESR